MSKGESQTSTVLIIVIGIFLIGALIGIFFPKNKTITRKESTISNNQAYVQGQNVNPLEQRETDAYYIKANIDKPVCGIKIFSPLPGQKVSFPLEVSGYVNGCGWVPFESEAGAVDIRDRNGSMSRSIILPVMDDDLTLPAYFKIKISPERNPETSEGVLIFNSRNIPGAQIETFQVPIIF